MTEKQHNSFKAKYSYDIDCDSMLVVAERDFNYEETIEMNDNVLLDFGKDNIPTGIEILEASRIFNVLKCTLNEPNFLNAAIEIADKLITVKFNIRTNGNSHSLEEYAINSRDIPDIETELFLIEM